MDLGLTERVAVVCGASQGMGRAIARGLAAEGARVLLCARRESVLREALDALHAELPDADLDCLAVDLTDPEAAGALIAQAQARWQRVDILVTNTGGPPPGQPLDMDDAHWQGALEQNFLNVVRLCRHAVPLMQQQGWGRVINLLSLSVRQVEENLALSSVARTAVVAYTKALSDQVAAQGITVNNVLPGSIATERLSAVAEMQAKFHGFPEAQAMDMRRAKIPAGRFGRPEEMADLVCFLASQRAAFITGLSIPLDGGQLRAVI